MKKLYILWGILGFFGMSLLMGCGGGGGSSSPATTQTETRISDTRTGAVLVAPSDVEGASSISFSTSDAPPAFDSMIQSVGPEIVIVAPQPVYNALQIEIPRDRITVSDSQTDSVQLFFYDDEDGAWLSFETSYSTETQKFTGYVMIPKALTGNTGQLKVRYGIIDMAAFQQKCEATGGNFNGAYCECGEATYWKNNTSGCVLYTSSARMSGMLSNRTLLATSANNYSVMTMNVGNVIGISLSSMLYGGSMVTCPKSKLCGWSNEKIIRRVIELGQPAIIMLQEVLPGRFLFFGKTQAERLLGSKYFYKCTDSSTNTSDDIDVHLYGNTSIKGYGYECIGIKRGMAIEFNDAFIPSDGFGHKIVVGNGDNEGDQDVALIADVTLKGGQTVRLINVHAMTPFKANILPPILDFDANAEERAKEIDYLIGLYAGQTPNVLIAGDFNITNNTYPYSQTDCDSALGGKLERCVLLRYLEQGIYPLVPAGEELIRGGEKEKVNDLYSHVKLTQPTTIIPGGYTLDYVLSTFADPTFTETENPCAQFYPFYPGMDHMMYYCILDFGEPPVAIGSLQIELRWGSSPSDLDSHITGPVDTGGRYHVYYSRAGETTGEYADYARLDRDDTSSYGPETTTVLRLPTGSSPIRYSVHNYSDKSSTYSTSLANSEATVKVYDNTTGGLLKQYYVPYENGTLWTVFEYSNGVFTDIESMSYEDTPFDVRRINGMGREINTDAVLIKTLPSK